MKRPAPFLMAANELIRLYIFRNAESFRSKKFTPHSKSERSRFAQRLHQLSEMADMTNSPSESFLIDATIELDFIPKTPLFVIAEGQPALLPETVEVDNDHSK